MKRHTCLILLLISSHFYLWSQGLHEDVFRGLNGEELAIELVNAFKPSIVLSESNMKDTLMAKVYYQDDQKVRCVYTHHEKSLDPESTDPNQEVFDNGQQTGLNVEHIFPKNKGAKFGRAASDMHHLAPAKVNVNSDRNNLPFGEIQDSETSRWYRGEIEMNNIPSTNIDEYSEWTNQRFEPREDFKGDVARAMFYFYTMYQNEADIEDPDFFSIQKETLCNWHYTDPVDTAEWTRTYTIGSFQGGKVNPFVLDCSLAGRLYCNNISDACETIVSVKEGPDNPTTLFKLYPNPTTDRLFIYSEWYDMANLELVIYNISGSIISRQYLMGNNLSIISVNTLETGLYMVEVRSLKDARQVVHTQKLIIK